jgi:hypothetical protein
MLCPIFSTMLSEPAPFLREPIIQKLSETTQKIHDHNYYTCTVKNRASHFTLLTLISEPPTFLTQGGYQGLRRGVPAFYNENDDGVMVVLLHKDVIIVALLYTTTSGAYAPLAPPVI